MKNEVHANAILQFAQDQCMQQYIEEPTRKNNILDVFLTNNDQLTVQIIITETLNESVRLSVCPPVRPSHASVIR